MNLILELTLFITGLVFTILILRYAFSSGSKNKEIFISADGTKFSSKEECDNYDLLFKSLELLYKEDSIIKASIRKRLIDLDFSFIKKITNEGFKDVKTLIENKNDFKKLVDIFQSIEKDKT